MKTMQKILTLALTLALVLTMAVTAFAETGGTITITGNANTEYSVYKMFDIEVTDDGGYKYKVTTEWAGFSADGYFDIKDGYVMWEKDSVSAADGAAVAQLARAYMSGKTMTVVDTASVAEAATVLDDGYYLLVPNDTTASGVVAVVGGENREVTAKTEEKEFPSVTKKVQEDSTQTYGDANDADIGQDVFFHSTITAGSNASRYILHDMMDEHFTFDASSISITRGGNTVATSDYEIKTGADCGDGCTFHVVFDETFCNSLTKGATLVVSYKAKLNANAAVDIAHENTTWLTHTTNIETDRATTETRTYQVVVNKVDQANAPLPGATFVLKDNVGKYYYWNATTNAVEWVDSVENATKLTTTEENNCQVVFNGVDAEVMTLVEYEVPGGYTGTTDVVVNTKEANDDGTYSKTVTVTNTLGTALPETGGMGTTLFYVAGGLLVVAAVVLLITKKRVNTAK